MQSEVYVSNEMARTIRNALNTLEVNAGDIVSEETLKEAFGVPEGLLLKQCFGAVEAMGLVAVSQNGDPKSYVIDPGWVVLRNAPKRSI
ncbi:hypothetical protein [Achromobacter sp. EB05]|uniref:hypothetical protein n=1 Tax=Achromobacter sp. EB05 TaxID=3142974 RepID=UPI0037846535